MAVSCSIVALVIVLAEILLRCIYGPPPSEPLAALFKYEFLEIHEPFFKMEELSGKKRYTPVRNRNCARPFPADKDSATIRIFLVGGSFVADWNPYMLEEQLHILMKENNLQKSCEIINCGMPAYDSYRVSLIVKEIIHYQPDCIIVLTGNNENIYSKKVDARLLNSNRCMRKFWAYRKAQDLVFQWIPSEKGVLKPDKENIDLKEKLREYKGNITTIVKYCHAKNISLILGTLPINLSGIPPAGPRPVDKAFLKGCLLLENDSISNAVNEFAAYIHGNQHNPFGYYYSGKAYERGDDYVNAKAQYYRTVKYDKAVRVNPEMNEFIRTVCKETSIGFMDIERALYHIAENEITDFRQFRDDCHIWPEYYRYINSLLCRELFNDASIGEKIFHAKHAETIVLDTITAPVISEYYYPLPKIRGVWEILSYAMAYTEDGVCEYAIKLFESARWLNPSALDSIQLFKERIKMIVQNDFYLSHVLQSDTTYDRQWPNVLYHAGELFRREKMYDKALAFFDASILQNNKNWLPYVGKALVFHSLNRKNEMVENLEYADQLGDSPEIRIYKELLSE